MKKNKVKIILIVVIILIVCLNIGVYAAYVLSATEVNYTKSDGSTVSVKAALDELHAKMPISVTATNIGDEVTVGGEQFYVLSFNDYDRTVDLIAKYNLNTVGTAQQNAAYGITECMFSSTNYWSSETSYPLNLNDYIGFTSTDALGKAKSYGRSKGAVSSRLLSYEEVKVLRTKASSNTEIYNMLWGKANSANAYLNYWLGSAYDANYVWYLNGSSSSYGYHAYFISSYYGVRPVIKVLKSSIS